MQLNHLIITAILLVISPVISLAERIEYPNGDVYEGEVRNGKPNGLGKVTYASGDIYMGGFSYGKRYGYGIYIESDGSVYEGEWKDNKSHGFGKATYGSKSAFRGDVYEGDFRDSSRHGFGKYTWVNGDIYEGEFSYGKRHGFGNYVKVGADSILGEWRNDQFTKQAEQLEAGKSNIRSSASRYLSRSPTNGSQKPQLNVWNQKSLELSRKIANLELAMKRLSKPKTSPRSYDNDELIAASSGTGFFVSKDGHLITNNHVISHCSQVKLKISGQFQDAQVIARDKVNDVALLKGSFKNFKTIPISSSNPELLQDIYAAGFPFGSSVSSSVKVTKGIVSSLSGVADNFSNVQIDAALQPGNSGGPIVDDYGNAVAVAVAKLNLEKIIKAYGVVPENTNFGIKATVVRNLLEANNIQVSKPNTTKLSGSELGQRITQGTVHLSCLMTMAQIEQVRDQKVLFTEYN